MVNVCKLYDNDKEMDCGADIYVKAPIIEGLTDSDTDYLYICCELHSFVACKCGEEDCSGWQSVFAAIHMPY